MAEQVVVSTTVTKGDDATDGTPRFVGSVLIGGHEITVVQSLNDPGAVLIEVDTIDHEPALPRLCVVLNDNPIFDDRQLS